MDSPMPQHEDERTRDELDHTDRTEFAEPVSTGQDDLAGPRSPEEPAVGHQQVAGEQPPAEAGQPPAELFEPGDVERFRANWAEIQTRFVDDPRDAVEGADRLVAEVLRSLTDRFTDRKHELEGRWQADGETEDLRQALRGYRSFFDRLLNV